MQCLNCGAPAGPNFCGYCGQAVQSHRLPLRALVREFLEEALSLDSRLVATIKTLPRPGLLTTRVLAGKRAQFVGPVRLYFVASVLLFSTVLALQTPSANDINLYIGGELMNGPADPRRTNIRIVSEDSSLGSLIAEQQQAKMAALKALPPQEMLERVFSGMRAVLPLTLIAFVPFLGLAFKLLYLRRRVLYVDHLVFAAHFQSALFLTLAIAWVIQRAAGLGLMASLTLYVGVWLAMLLWYLPAGLKRMHQQGVGITVIKTLALCLLYLQLLFYMGGMSIVYVLLRV
jgi:hypothetical protein